MVAKGRLLPCIALALGQKVARHPTGFTPRGLQCSPIAPAPRAVTPDFDGAVARGSGLKHFVKTAGTIERHIDGILEYVRTRFSNGRTEGMNGKIRTITRQLFGLHSARALISMIFLCCSGVYVTPAFSGPSGSH